MSQDVVEHIESLRTKAGQEWQADVAVALRQAVHLAIPEVRERLQYGKPHFLKGMKNAAVISASNAALSFTIFNAAELSAPGDSFFEPGPAERRTVKIKKGQQPDYDLLTTMVREAAAGLLLVPAGPGQPQMAVAHSGWSMNGLRLPCQES